MSGADYAAWVSEAFTMYRPKFRDLNDETFQLGMAAIALAKKRLSEEEFDSLQGFRFLTIAESPAYRARFMTIYEEAGHHDLLEAAAKPSEWAAELPWDEHIAIIDRLSHAERGTSVLRIWRHFIGKIAEGFWWWVRERDTTHGRSRKGLKPELGSVAAEACVEAVAEHKVTFLAALDMATPAFERFGSDRDKAWLKALRRQAETEERDRVTSKPNPSPMTEELFWQIISSGGETSGERLETLSERLAVYKAKEIKTFGQFLVDKTSAAYRADIWALAYLLMRGASDDAFDAFRNWLVFQGRETYLDTLADPDEFDVVGLSETPMTEGALSLVELAYELRAGKPMPRLKYPKAKVVEINEDDIPGMLPQISEKTGTAS